METVKEDAQGYKIYIKEDVPLNRSDRTACENVGIKETDDKKVTEALKKLKKVIRVWIQNCGITCVKIIMISELLGQ